MFLLANDAGRGRIFIFATDSNLQHLSACDQWYMDGTFYSSPIHFTQLYTIHGFINGYMFPLVYGLLPNKTQATYERFFGLLKEKSAERHIILNPTSAMMDFEVAASNALTTVFRMVAGKGCFFHFSQAIWRKVQALGLVAVS